MRLLIVGEGDFGPAAREYVQETNLKDIEFLGAVDDGRKRGCFEQQICMLRLHYMEKVLGRFYWKQWLLERRLWATEMKAV